LVVDADGLNVDDREQVAKEGDDIGWSVDIEQLQVRGQLQLL
jgi:hypothetical protein